jgi:polyhydroxybutyrate depolymerase
VRRVLPVLFVLGLVAAGCGESTGGDDQNSADVICEADVPDCVEPEGATAGITPAPSVPSTATAEAGAEVTQGVNGPATSNSCSPARPHASGDTTAEITSDGLVRTYILHVPPTYTGETAVSLVINLHGYGSNATDQAYYSGFPALADREGFIVVSPNGSGYPQRWAFPGLGGADDVGFIGELLGALERELCIDTSRVYAVGMSNGAAITTFVACAMPERIAAIGAVAATAGPRACGTDVPIPLITFRATEDQCVPYGGGTSACGMMLPVIAAEESVRMWAEHNACSPQPEVTQLTEHVRVTAYGGCAAEADVRLYTTGGDGHTWPGAINVPRLGHVTDEIDATAIMWEFFKAHTR